MTGSARVGWSAALVGWTGRSWVVHARRGGALEGPQRKALFTFARRAAKRVARVDFLRDRGRTLTGRPKGVRMGKGKGKPRGYRGWVPPGGALLSVRGVPRGLTALPGRSGLGLLLRRSGW